MFIAMRWRERFYSEWKSAASTVHIMSGEIKTTVRMVSGVMMLVVSCVIKVCGTLWYIWMYIVDDRFRYVISVVVESRIAIFWPIYHRCLNQGWLLSLGCRKGGGFFYAWRGLCKLSSICNGIIAVGL
ncbi:hypothetical protein BpHYR1_000548 [Brachionus plicatilis]|uniref:Uncharacterized protein n=1 Tax=Brachionus plicatilis TaxID=10195 RepID=A0A3M7RAS1_BRAPC|nr:hypothetical protein BpHYR1_000548 [Brachionus plicatilis]